MRVSLAQLEAVVKRINEVTNSPMTYSTQTEDVTRENVNGERIKYPTFETNVGHYHLDRAYGGNKLVRTVNNGGGITEITYGFVSKRECYDKMQSFLSGLELSKEIKNCGTCWEDNNKDNSFCGNCGEQFL